MTVRAYVLTQTEVGRAVHVSREVALIDGVIAADNVTGPYDVIVVAEAPTMDALGRMVASTMQAVGGIVRTTTCPTVNL